jgi:formate hydrogenlyase transcriptional activator
MNRVIDTIPSEAMNALMEYSWPGNIRELQNFIERAVILTSGPVLRVPLQDLPKRATSTSTSTKSEFRTIADTERDLILETLKKTKWVIAGPNGAAERLGMNRSTLRFRMNKLGIIKPWKTAAFFGAVDAFRPGTLPSSYFCRKQYRDNVRLPALARRPGT